MCGLAAYVGESYSPLLFKLVALAQDAKGRDNAGIGYIKSGAFKVALGGSEPERIFKSVLNSTRVKSFPAYPATSLAELLGDHTTLPTKINSPIFAHSRKATIGNSAPKNAQPFIDKNIMLMHNGTITNHKEFRETYKLPEYSSDSQILAYMLSRGKEEAMFGLYTGTATAIWADQDDESCYYVWAGTAHHYATTPPKATKSLYYLRTLDGVYSSSDKRALEIVAELLKTPTTPLYTVQEYSPNTIFRVSKDGIETVQYISRKQSTSTPTEEPKKNPVGQSLQKLYKDKKDLVQDEPDLLQYAAGKYYINGEAANTKWKITPNSTLEYYSIYVSKASFLCYKKTADDTFVTYTTGKNCVENAENLIAIPLLDGILLRKWENFHKICRNYAAVTVAMLAQHSALPVNIRLYQEDKESEYFITQPGKVINYSITAPFTLKQYTYKSNMLTSVSDVRLNNARRITQRYIDRMDTDASVKVDPPMTSASKFKVILGVLLRITENDKFTEKEKQAANQAAIYLNSKLGINDSRIRN